MSGRPGRLTSLLGALAVALPPAPAAQDLEPVRRVLRARTLDRRTEPELVEELARLDTRGVAPLFSLYAENGLDALLAGGDASNLAEGWWGGAPDRYGELAFRALARLSPGRVVEHVEARCAPEAPLERRLAGLRLLGELASASALPAVYRIAADLSEEELRYRTARTAVSDAVTAILREDPDSLREVESYLPVLEGPLLAATLEALGESRSGAAMELLVDLLGAEPERDAFLLDRIASLGESCPWRIESDPRREVRRRLRDDAWRVRRAAATCLARLVDGEAARDLVDLLDDPSSRVRSAVQWALGRLAETRGERSREEWEHWIDREEERWLALDDRGRLHLAELEPAEAAAVVRRASQCVLRRRDAARLVAEALEHEAPEVAAAAAGALHRLGGLEVLPDLADTLRAREDLARRAAWECLRALTGEDLPPDSEAWRGYLEQG